MTRRYLTPKERADMLIAQGGLCAICKRDVRGNPFIAEHWVPVALGNAEKPDCLLCVPCADRKTNGSPATTYGSDSHAIAKVKRLRGETGQGPKKRIPSRPMPTAPEGHRYSWPSRAIPSRKVREARHG